MLDLIRLHRRYLLCKMNYIIFSALLVIICLGYLISIQPFETQAFQDLNRENNAMIYVTNMQMITKLALILLAGYLYGTSFSRHYDNYNVLYLSHEHNRMKYFLTKFLSLTVLYILLCLICLVMFLTIGYLYTTWFSFRQDMLIYFLLLIIEGVIYGTLSTLLCMMLNNLFCTLIPYGLFIVGEIVNEQKSANLLIRIFNFFFPSIIGSNQEIYFVFGIWHALIIMTSFIILSAICFVVKDLA
jgi:hypothetical protein